ncbi:phosphopantetheine-binding protein [Streptomyces sp. AC602_WCS936]|uniref:phosphopantetheine-binding protein n=1 Tax=Streptomyces sp. AC602_WCS936 TaxID=2823685 RepID=UPI001C2515FE|nr:phosphopantetheine-binding protein [Streptomyces sp. AC602_WCS936]
MSTPWDSRFEALVARHVDFGRSMLPDDDLFALGLDSIAVVELVVCLEETYGIEIPDDRLSQQTFATPAVLWSLVAGLLPAGPRAEAGTPA